MESRGEKRYVAAGERVGRGPRGATGPPPEVRVRVLKFGGTSLLDAGRVRTAVDVVKEAAGEGPVAVVVSAMGGVTDALAATADDAARGDQNETEVCREIERRHREVLLELAPPGEVEALLVGIDAQMRELVGLMQGVSLVRECTSRTRDEMGVPLYCTSGAGFKAPPFLAEFPLAGTLAEWTGSLAVAGSSRRAMARRRRLRPTVM